MLLLGVSEINCQDHIVKKIIQFPNNIPDAKTLQRFFGVVNYARDFIPNISGHTSSKKKWSFAIEDQNVVKNIKDLVQDLPPLHLRKECDCIILQTYANDYYWLGIIVTETPETNLERFANSYQENLILLNLITLQAKNKF